MLVPAVLFTVFVYAVATAPLVTAPTAYVCRAPKLHVGVVVAEIVLTVASCVFLALTAWSDPGYLPRNSPAQAEAERLKLVEAGKFDHSLCCKYPIRPAATTQVPCRETHTPMFAAKCNTWRRGTSVHHCYANGRCVEGYDHHCPWMGKAIGALTLKFFYGFLYSVCSLLALTGISTVIWLLEGGAADA